MLKPDHADLKDLKCFLKVETPSSWYELASKQFSLLLLDHAHCERKAAATAIQFINKYPEKKALVNSLSHLAREELLHFEKVLAILDARNISYRPLPPSNYAKSMHSKVIKKGCTLRLCEELIIAAIIEARSCERLHGVAEYLDDKIIARFISN